MPRSVWKGPFFRLSLLNRINAFRRSVTMAASAGNAVSSLPPQPLLTKDRASTIIPAMVGVTLQVHNGRDYIPLTIREEMVGMKIGALVACRKPFTFRQTNAGKKAKK